MAQLLCTHSATASGTVEIEVRRPATLVAPAQVWLRAINHAGLAAFEQGGTYWDGAHHEYYHEWTINGEPLSDWTRPENLIAEHNKPNKAWGREVGFLLPDVGSYTIDLVVTDRNGKTAFASTETFTVITPESHFALADRIYVDTTGIYDGVPSASRRASSLAGLKTQLEAAGGGNLPWVLFRAGQTFSATGLNKGWLRISSARPVARMSSYGTGDRPIIVPSAGADKDNNRSMFDFRDNFPADGLAVTGLDFIGP